MLAIARVDRAYKDKPGGLVVDCDGLVGEQESEPPSHQDTKEKIPGAWWLLLYRYHCAASTTIMP